jgi:hypothetical protein
MLKQINREVTDVSFPRLQTQPTNQWVIPFAYAISAPLQINLFDASQI